MLVKALLVHGVPQIGPILMAIQQFSAKGLTQRSMMELWGYRTPVSTAAIPAMSRVLPIAAGATPWPGALLGKFGAKRSFRFAETAATLP